MSGPAPPAKPKRARPARAPAARAFGRSLTDFGTLHPAERKLLECCRRGEIAILGEERPLEETRANRVRASFVRFLTLGGDSTTPVHELGVALRGAWLLDLLDLDDAEVERQLSLWNCRIGQIDARQAKLKLLDLEGSLLAKGLNGDRLRSEGGIYLRHGFHSTGQVRMLGARIDGNFSAKGAHFDNEGGIALALDGARIDGNVFIGDGFQATGEVRLVGVIVNGDLDCQGGEFENPEGDALACDGAVVSGHFFFRSLGHLDGGVDLSSMRVGALCDGAEGWQGAESRTVLDGFVYDRLAGRAPTNAETRIAWLDRQLPKHLSEEFRPQPWEQLITVLRAMGHPGDARSVAIAKQDRLRRTGKLARGARVLHWLYGLLVGYGYRPMRLLATTAVVWLLCAGAYWAGTNPTWFGADTHLLAPPDPGPGAPARAADYRNFVPLIYSADVLLPVVDLGYKDEWQPVVADRAGKPLIWGQLLRFLYWFEIAFGWVAGLLLVGVLGNLIKKD